MSFAPGFPAPETFAWQDFQAITQELLSGRDGSVLQYGPTRGFRPLLDAIAGIMSSRGAETAHERLLVTTGSQQGLDLVARVLLDPHDVILVELPTYTGAISAFRNVQADMIGVRQGADGIDLGELDDTCERLRRAGRRARLLYLVPNFQNPTGLLIGLQKRVALLEWAERRDVLLVEDDPVSRPVLRRLGNRGGRAAAARRRSLGPGHLLEQLFEDAGTRLSRGMDRCAAAGHSKDGAGEAGGGPLHW